MASAVVPPRLIIANGVMWLGQATDMLNWLRWMSDELMFLEFGARIPRTVTSQGSGSRQIPHIRSV